MAGNNDSGPREPDPLFTQVQASAVVRYREGTVDFLVRFDAERERLAAEDAQAQAEVELYRGIVAIYKALGGGWQPNA